MLNCCSHWSIDHTSTDHLFCLLLCYYFLLFPQHTLCNLIPWKYSDRKPICDHKFISRWLQTSKKLLLRFLASVPQQNKISTLPAFIYVDAAIDHAHKEIMSLGFNVSRWARTLIRKSIVLSIGLAVLGKGLQSEASVGVEWKATYSAIAQQFYNLSGIWSVASLGC